MVTRNWTLIILVLGMIGFRPVHQYPDYVDSWRNLTEVRLVLPIGCHSHVETPNLATTNQNTTRISFRVGSSLWNLRHISSGERMENVTRRISVPRGLCLDAQVAITWHKERKRDICRVLPFSCWKPVEPIFRLATSSKKIHWNHPTRRNELT